MVVGLCEVVHDTVDIGFGVLWTVDVHMLVRGNVHRVGDAEVVPQDFVKCGVLVDPQNFLNRYDSVRIRRCHNEEMFCDEQDRKSTRLNSSHL